MNESQKKCSKCGEYKDLIEFYVFNRKYKNSKQKIRVYTEISSQCKKCHNESTKQWRANLPIEKRRQLDREKMVKYRKNHLEKSREYVRNYHKNRYHTDEAFRKRMIESSKKWHEKKKLEQSITLNCNK